MAAGGNEGYKRPVPLFPVGEQAMEYDMGTVILVNNNYEIVFDKNRIKTLKKIKYKIRRE